MFRFGQSNSDTTNNGGNGANGVGGAGAVRSILGNIHVGGKIRSLGLPSSNDSVVTLQARIRELEEQLGANGTLAICKVSPCMLQASGPAQYFMLKK